MAKYKIVGRGIETDPEALRLLDEHDREDEIDAAVAQKIFGQTPSAASARHYSSDPTTPGSLQARLYYLEYEPIRTTSGEWVVIFKQGPGGQKAKATAPTLALAACLAALRAADMGMVR